MDNNFENPYFKPETPAVQPENNFVAENSNPPAQQAVVGSNFTVNPDITPQVFVNIKVIWSNIGNN